MKTHFIVGQQSDQGPRDYQEDSLAVRLNLADPPLASRKGALFLVADGVGGSYGGDMASAIAADIIPRSYFGDPRADVIEALRTAFVTANLVIYEKTHPSGETHMATTAVCVVVRESQLYAAHVGDSRAYLWRKGYLRQLTQDHSWVTEQVQRGLLSIGQAAVHPRRNIITRSLGAKSDVRPDIRYYGRLYSGDRLLLCSDGLHDVVSETSLAAVLDTRAPPEACQELIELAKKAGTGDNVTVIVAEFQCAPVVDPIIGLGSPMANSRGVQHTETVRFRHSPDQAPFEETRDLWITPSKCVTCGVTVRPEDYWGRYPACIELWLDTGTERISRFLVGSGGDQVNWPKNLTANSVDMIAGDSEIALQVAELTIIASVRDVSFATAQKGQFRQVTIDFEFTFDPVLADARPS